MQFEYFNARLLQNAAVKIKQTVGAVTPPNGYAFGVLSALTNLEITNSDLIENVNSVYVNTLDVKIPTEETMVEYVEYVFEHDAAKRDSVIIKSNTIPAASAELLGYEYQYMGETNNTYTHGFVYVCKGIPTDTLVFTPDTVSCDWADLSAFLQTETADYNSVVAGSMTYFADAELWRATFTDANGDTVLTYQQYTGDWENVGFVFSGTYEDGDVVSFVRNTEFDYVWERIDLQPGGAAQVIDVKVNGTSVVENNVADINVPTKTSDLTNDSGFITNSDLPTVGNGTITITQGGTTKGTFTTNQGGNTTIDLDAGAADPHRVIEFQAPTADNNYTWYRKYADGWVEQGGYAAVLGQQNTTITLPVEMADTNYGVQVTNDFNNATNQYGSQCNGRSVTQIIIKCGSYSSGDQIHANWQVSGMAAS